MDLPALVTKERWSRRAQFPSSVPLGGRVFTCGDGLYLITNPNYGDDDPVRGVGWAESDYWALRAWASPPFAGELAAPEPQWGEPPSLRFLGRPASLRFAEVREFERWRVGPLEATLLETAKYRLTDGAFLHVSINGADGIFYIYGSNKPKPDDQPVAIEFRLPER